MEKSYKGKYIGGQIQRMDAFGHVTGNTIYASDRAMPGMLHAKVLRHNVHAGYLRSIDTSEAEKIPGVVAIITEKDIPGLNLFGLKTDEPVINNGLLRRKGEIIAAVAAVDEATAIYACSKIKYEIEEKDPVFDIDEAVKDGAPQVRPEGNYHLFDGPPYPPYRRLRYGDDIDEALASADHIIEGYYDTPPQEHAPMETGASLAYIDETGTLTIYTNNQGPFEQGAQIAAIMHLTSNQVVMKGGTLGGSFGGRNAIHTDHIAALLALKSHRPVRFHMTREEEMLHSTIRGPWRFSVTDGVMNDGRIVARKVIIWHDAGAYSGLAWYAVEKCVLTVAGPYEIPNVYVDGYCIYTNKIVASSMRGFGINVGQFAIESNM
ncbi:MAG: molybdopterin-dependent oxidoreductase, partial [Clostridiales Family XIII bacterium]|nr:molybdopterin-dependent oxidoreductase [Clostridiales Family XIII bacterium]